MKFQGMLGVADVVYGLKKLIHVIFGWFKFFDILTFTKIE